jgi:hypothetical protein
MQNVATVAASPQYVASDACTGLCMLFVSKPHAARRASAKNQRAQIPDADEFDQQQFQPRDIATCSTAIAPRFSCHAKSAMCVCACVCFCTCVKSTAFCVPHQACNLSYQCLFLVRINPASHTGACISGSHHTVCLKYLRVPLAHANAKKQSASLCARW